MSSPEQPKPGLTRRAKINLAVVAATISLILAACGGESYSLETARECVADGGFEVGTISQLGTAEVFAGWWPAGSPVSERQFVVTVRDTEAAAEEWLTFWKANADPPFVSTSREGRSAVGWRYEPPADESEAVLDCLKE
jgi:hypothetical protein